MHIKKYFIFKIEMCVSEDLKTSNLAGYSLTTCLEIGVISLGTGGYMEGMCVGGGRLQGDVGELNW